MPAWTDPCPTCPRRYRAIGGDGPRSAPVLAIMERPGRDENSAGRVACGKTGQELDELYLPLAGMERSDIRVCNTVLCWADSNKTPTDKEIAACAPYHLPDEIRRTDPYVILLLGSTACSLVPGIRLDLHHGIPQHTSKAGKLFGWSGWLVPMYHPSIGLHESRWMKICMDDWLAIREAKYYPDPAPPPTDYRLWTGQKEWIRDLHSPGVDTESHGGRPWSVQISPASGHGYLFRVNDPEALGLLRWIFAHNERTEFVFHNAAYDIEVLRRLGICVRRYRDTMQEAFHLGNLPQGLKPLVYRLFRYTMTNYDETVRPASVRALESWMTEAFCIAQLDLSFVERRQLKTKIKEIVHKGELEMLLTRLMRLTTETGEYDPWERLDAFWSDPTNDWMVSHIESRIGPYPILGIANCTMEEAVRYATGDADWTAQVAVELERRRSESFQVFEGDQDQ
jgi:uracil-DNA glycosylase